MNLHLETKNYTKDIDISEQDIYTVIAGCIRDLDAPDYIAASCEYGKAKYQAIKRSGAFFVREEYNDITMPSEPDYPSVYLVCVNPEHNNYKFYKLEDLHDGNIMATYGRVGASSHEMYGERTHVYPKRMYYIKLIEKLNKGYKDMSDIYLTDDTKDDSNPSEQLIDEDINTPSTRLYKKLLSYSKKALEYSCISTNVTKMMVETTKELLIELYNETSDVTNFNNILLKLFAVSPRKTTEVSCLLAKGVSDFETIVSREDNLYMAMHGVLESSSRLSNTCKVNAFTDIDVYEATASQKEEVLSHLNDSLKCKVKNIYRVICNEQKKRFDDYLKQNNITKVKQFWHGSRNENWLSIVNTGLLLKPNAVITGKMLGNGIYFAPSSMKSWNYTSYHNTYWARGNSDTAFMGLYACAYGKPLDVTGPGTYTQDIINSKGCNCVHAHAGNYLRNDEIVFYDEAAMLLNYIVEFGN